MMVENQILDYVINYIREHGYSPLVREIGDAVELKSTSSIHAHIREMIEIAELQQKLL